MKHTDKNKGRIIYEGVGAKGGRAGDDSAMHSAMHAQRTRTYLDAAGGAGEAAVHHVVRQAHRLEHLHSSCIPWVVGWRDGAVSLVVGGAVE